MNLDRQTADAILDELFAIEMRLLQFIGMSPEARDDTKLQAALDRIVALQRRVRKSASA